jgi:predicted PP-loop superfamily ATPase
MFKTLKDSAAAFTYGLTVPAAIALDGLTSDKFELEEKVFKKYGGNDYNIAVALSGGAGLSTSVVGITFALMASALSLGDAIRGTSDSEAQLHSTHKSVTVNTNAGVQKVQEAASVLGIIVPKFDAF